VSDVVAEIRHYARELADAAPALTTEQSALLSRIFTPTSGGNGHVDR